MVKHKLQDMVTYLLFDYNIIKKSITSMKTYFHDSKCSLPLLGIRRMHVLNAASSAFVSRPWRVWVCMYTSVLSRFAASWRKQSTHDLRSAASERRVITHDHSALHSSHWLTDVSVWWVYVGKVRLDVRWGFTLWWVKTGAINSVTFWQICVFQSTRGYNFAETLLVELLCLRVTG